MKMPRAKVDEFNSESVLTGPDAKGNQTTVLAAWDVERSGVWCASPHCKARHNFTIGLAIVAREGSTIPLPMIALAEEQEFGDDDMSIGSMTNMIITKDALAELIRDAQEAFEALP